MIMIEVIFHGFSTVLTFLCRPDARRRSMGTTMPFRSTIPCKEKAGRIRDVNITDQKSLELHQFYYSFPFCVQIKGLSVNCGSNNISCTLKQDFGQNDKESPSIESMTSMAAKLDFVAAYKSESAIFQALVDFLILV